MEQKKQTSISFRIVQAVKNGKLPQDARKEEQDKLIALAEKNKNK